LADYQLAKPPKKVEALVKKREVLRKKGQWPEADKLRKEIKKLGWQLEDTKKGVKLKPV
jgi:cysteinyl-tRNA synthetase